MLKSEMKALIRERLNQPRKAEVVEVPKESKRAYHFGPPVAFTKVAESEFSDLEFSARKAQPSPYRDALASLRVGEVLRFESEKCLWQIKVNARKLGLEIVFAVKDGALLVKLAPPKTSEVTRNPRQIESDRTRQMSEAVVQGLRQGKIPTGKATLNDRVMAAIQLNPSPMTSDEVFAAVRAQGVATTIGDVRVALQAEKAAGKIETRPSDILGGRPCWHLIGSNAAHA